MLPLISRSVLLGVTRQYIVIFFVKGLIFKEKHGLFTNLTLPQTNKDEWDYMGSYFYFSRQYRHIDNIDNIDSCQFHVLSSAGAWGTVEVTVLFFNKD